MAGQIAQTPSPLGLADLPVELRLQVLGCLDTHGDRAAVATTCRRLYQDMESFLWSSVEVRTPRGLRSLLEAMRRREERRAAVKNFSVFCTEETLQLRTGLPYEGEDFSEIEQLKHIHHVRIQLDLKATDQATEKQRHPRVQSFRSWWYPQVKSICAANHETLRTCHLDFGIPTWVTGAFWMVDDVQAVFSLRLLESLTLVNAVFGQDLGSWHGPKGSCNVREVDLIGCSMGPRGFQWLIEHSPRLKRLRFDATIHCHAATPNWRFILGFLVENKSGLELLELSPIPVVTISTQEVLTKGFSRVDISRDVTLNATEEGPHIEVRLAEQIQLVLSPHNKWSESPLLLSLCTDVAMSSFGLREFSCLKKLVLSMPSPEYMPEPLLSILENSNLPIMLKFTDLRKDAAEEALASLEITQE